MAIGLVGAGSGIGGILFTPIIKYILEEYAVKGLYIFIFMYYREHIYYMKYYIIIIITFII